MIQPQNFSPHSLLDAIDAVFNRSSDLNAFLPIQLGSKEVEEENRTQLQCHISPFSEPSPVSSKTTVFAGTQSAQVRREVGGGELTRFSYRFSAVDSGSPLMTQKPRLEMRKKKKKKEKKTRLFL
ncbi:hypothetical protein CEXT_722081 [Caerostris extrusa]|uniref:Uncharacterized protein n=1 Tax=Caerostris extrusa TaxID=172846 RepID=A0AAV4Y9H9_CAEEX|nr:hypothetical protein CEXT_722081 [Caerostris extrusa]